MDRVGRTRGPEGVVMGGPSIEAWIIEDGGGRFEWTEGGRWVPGPVE